MASKKTKSKSKSAAPKSKKPVAKKASAKKPAAKKPAAKSAKKPVAKKAPAKKSIAKPAKKAAKEKKPIFLPKGVLPPSTDQAAKAEASALYSKGTPAISDKGHAAHVTRKNAPAVKAALLDVLKKGEHSFEALEAVFPGLTKNQLRYQLSGLRDQGLASKSGTRDNIVYQAVKK